MKDGGHALPFSEALFETQHFVLENSYFLGNMNELSVTIAYREMYVEQEVGVGHFLNTFRCKSDATSSFEFRKDDCSERSSASVELASFSLRSEGKLGTTGRMIELMGDVQVSGSKSSTSSSLFSAARRSSFVGVSICEDSSFSRTVVRPALRRSSGIVGTDGVVSVGVGDDIDA